MEGASPPARARPPLSGAAQSDIDSKLSPGIPVVLLGNKCDLAREGSFAQTAEQMQEFCKTHGFAAFFETSAKDNINVDAAARKLVEEIRAQEKEAPPKAQDTVALDKQPDADAKGCPC